MISVTSAGKLIILNALNGLLDKKNIFISMMLYPLIYTSMINFRAHYEETACASIHM